MVKHSHDYLEAAANMRGVWNVLARFKRRHRDGMSPRATERIRRKETARG